MPVLTRFPGGGGAAGYMYQSRDVISPSISTGADNKISLQWQDPDDIFFNEEAMMEWKGTLVVCKQGAAPVNPDDGVVVCDSRVKNQYKNSPLLTDIGGANHYYGIFPYTKDYVVNVGSANVLYCLGQLDGTSWADIAACSASGLAQQWWKVGDEKKITLSGDYNGEIILQIADFNHDNLTDGSGKAGITFLTKQLIGNEVMNTTATNSGGWRDSYMRNTIMPKIKNSLPADLQNVIKKVEKLCTTGNSNTGLITVEDELFIPSATEIGGFAGYSFNPSSSSYYLISGDGTLYPVFKTASDSRKSTITGEEQGWWVRTTSDSRESEYRGKAAFGRIFYRGLYTTGFHVYPANMTSSPSGVCFGFCV